MILFALAVSGCDRIDWSWNRSCAEIDQWQSGGEIRMVPQRIPVQLAAETMEKLLLSIPPEVKRSDPYCAYMRLNRDDPFPTRAWTYDQLELLPENVTDSAPESLLFQNDGETWQFTGVLEYMQLN